MQFLQQITEPIRCFAINLLRRPWLKRVHCLHCGESFAKLHLILADDIWDETNGHNSGILRRDVWAFCPACQTTYDFSLLKMRFVVSDSNDLIKEDIRQALEADREKSD